MTGPTGAPGSSENVSVLAGMSVSVAVAVKVNVANSFPDLLPIAASTGAEFTSFTAIEKAAEPLSTGLPLSVAVTVTGYVPGPCASVGTQLNAPVEALIVAPVAAGVPSVKDQVIVLAGRSVSVAVTVKASVANSLTDLLPGCMTTGDD